MAASSENQEPGCDLFASIIFAIGHGLLCLRESQDYSIASGTHFYNWDPTMLGQSRRVSM